MIARQATTTDVPLLAELNHQLIQDQQHRNPMSILQLAERMRGWLDRREYIAVIFEHHDEVVAYGLYREEPTELYLRQFFVVRHRRRASHGREAMQILMNSVWPKNKRCVLEVLVENASARRFYQALGFCDYSVTMEMLPTATSG